MILADRIRLEPLRVVADLDRYFSDSTSKCPYGLPYKAVYRQARFDGIPEPIMELLLAAGYRRNGNSFYTMRCLGCSACIPIRLATRAFRPNRNQRRVLKRNQDLEIEIGPLAMNDENLALMEAFLASRYPGRGNTAADYYADFFRNPFGCSQEIRFRLAGRLVGVAIVDVGNNWCNAVYFYFDPEMARRSPGTFNILTLIDSCRTKGIDILYLGYWIEEVRAMKYKAAFRPHFLLINSEWSNYQVKF